MQLMAAPHSDFQMFVNILSRHSCGVICLSIGVSNFQRVPNFLDSFQGILYIAVHIRRRHVKRVAARYVSCLSLPFPLVPQGFLWPCKG